MKIKSLIAVSLLTLSAVACSPSKPVSSGIDGYRITKLDVTEDTRAKMMAGNPTTPVYEVTLTPITKGTPAVAHVSREQTTNPIGGMVCYRVEDPQQTAPESQVLHCLVTKEKAPLVVKLAIESNEFHLEALKKS